MSTSNLQTVILAAGLGTRLGRPLPKPLTRLADGQTIIGQQIANIRSRFGEDAQIMVVVGFKLESILEANPDVAFAYNESYDQTNTSKSLLRALRLTGDRGVLWLNGDVVFDAKVLDRVTPMLERDDSFVCVNTASVGDEEIKYLVDDRGMISELSKSVVGGLGEAVGINYIGSKDKTTLISFLDAVGEQDYFERAIERAISEAGVSFTPIDISDLFAVEVDFEEDLNRVNRHL